jgi:y4mF family transcriptional regulator
LIEIKVYIPDKVQMKSEIIVFVKDRRKRLNLTQHDLADRAGVGLRFIRELEQGKATLRMDKVNLVLALFGHCLGPVPARRVEAAGDA